MRIDFHSGRFTNVNFDGCSLILTRDFHLITLVCDSFYLFNFEGVVNVKCTTRFFVFPIAL